MAFVGQLVNFQLSLRFDAGWAKSLLKNCPQWLQYDVFSKNETVFDIYPQYVILFFCFLKHHINGQYKVLIDLTGVDYPSRGLSWLWGWGHPLRGIWGCFASP